MCFYTVLVLGIIFSTIRTKGKKRKNTDPDDNVPQLGSYG